MSNVDRKFLFIRQRRGKRRGASRKSDEPAVSRRGKKTIELEHSKEREVAERERIAESDNPRNRSD